MSDKKKITYDHRHGGHGRYIKQEDAEKLPKETWTKERRSPRQPKPEEDTKDEQE